MVSAALDHLPTERSKKLQYDQSFSDNRAQQPIKMHILELAEGTVIGTEGKKWGGGDPLPVSPLWDYQNGVQTCFSSAETPAPTIHWLCLFWDQEQCDGAGALLILSVLKCDP